MDDDESYELKALRDTHNELQKILDDLHKYQEELIAESKERTRRWDMTNLSLLLQRLKPGYGNRPIDEIVVSFVFGEKKLIPTG